MAGPQRQRTSSRLRPGPTTGGAPVPDPTGRRSDPGTSRRLVPGSHRLASCRVRPSLRSNGPRAGPTSRDPDSHRRPGRGRRGAEASRTWFVPRTVDDSPGSAVYSRDAGHRRPGCSWHFVPDRDGSRGPPVANRAGLRCSPGHARGLTDSASSAVPSSACGPLAQLARAPASHAGGHWFKSSTVHHCDQRKCWSSVLFRWCPARQLLASWPLSRSFSSVPWRF